ncbi:MAG TPA: LCP family protein [Chloroflexota bacterium]
MRVEYSRAGETRRTRLGCGVAVLTALFVSIVVSIFAAVFFLLSAGSSQVAASFIHAQPGSLAWDQHSRLTILLLGRSSDSDPAAATNSITVAMYDPAAQRIQLLSIPPNLWVTIPGFGEGRIADAYGDGGTRLALLTVQSVLHIPIPYYVVLGPHTLNQAVDGMGGVTVTVPQAITIAHAHFSPGTTHLDGQATLRYSAIASGDPQDTLAGMQRQQQLLLALRRQTFSPQSVFHIPTIINTLGGSVSTNFPYDQVIDLVHRLDSVPSRQIAAESLSYANNTVTAYASQNGPVMLADWQHIQRVAHSLFPMKSVPGSGAVEVVNGTGVPGQAVSLASWLRSDGVRVSGYATGPAAGYSATTVVVARNATSGTRQLAGTVATLLQTPVVTGSSSGRPNRVTVQLGRDFQDPTQQ